MATHVQLVRDEADPEQYHVKIPAKLLRQARLSPWSDLILRVRFEQLILESKREDLSQFERYTEQFISGHLPLLRVLEDRNG